MAALSFKCSATNTMIFPLDLIAPTILDITIILGTSPSSLPIHIALFRYEFNLDLKTVFDERAVEVLKKKDQRSLKEDVHKLHKNFFNYNILIIHFAGSEEEELKKGEHNAFLFYWYNKYIFCTRTCWWPKL